MRLLILSIIYVFAFSFSTSAQTSQSIASLKNLIDSLFRVDQGVQHNMINAIQNGHSDSYRDSVAILEKQKNEAFARHILIMRQIIKDYGFPNPNLVGAETTYQFFTLIQHSKADVAFQSEMLPYIKELVDKEQLKGSVYALLYDKIQINLGKAQLYGSQVDYKVDGSAFPKNLDDPKNVNTRRAAYGMEKLEIYLDEMTKLHKEMNAKK
jgi:hypothetical protein